MARIKEIPIINHVTISYNGNKNAFENFVKAMIFEHLNSCAVPKNATSDFIRNGEFNEKIQNSLAM